MTGKKFEELMEIMRKLRIECPWDREQDHHSIKDATIEEAYEVVDAIDNDDLPELRKELGDLLLHIVFHSVIAEGNKEFNIEDVIDGIKEKLIRRHPHVFGNTEVNGSKEIESNWEKIKMQEGRKSVLEGIPKNLPALIKAQRMQQKASKVGFDWDNENDVFDKIHEEIKELNDIKDTGSNEEVEGEIGDLLFSIVNFCRFRKISAEDALKKSTKKFQTRFEYIEKRLEENGKSVLNTNLQEMDEYWNESKKNR